MFKSNRTVTGTHSLSLLNPCVYRARFLIRFSFFLEPETGYLLPYSNVKGHLAEGGWVVGLKVTIVRHSYNCPSPLFRWPNMASWYTIVLFVVVAQQTNKRTLFVNECTQAGESWRSDAPYRKLLKNRA